VRYHASRDPGSRGTSEGRVLIVDDETAIRLICRLNLRSAGFDTLEASDGPSAIAVARAERPDLILLDVMLPKLDGWHVAEELAANDETREIPVLFLSARSESGDQVRGHGAGGVGYITKPFDPLAMTNTVRDVLERVRRGERDAMRRDWQRSLGRN
jgi:two-component system OmpR family response regulator/two-component system alkaline phosphatase synthesis response regulator PhoP